jgi:hypothetical protein
MAVADMPMDMTIAAPVQAESQCVLASRALDKGFAPVAADFAPAQCDVASSAAPLRYDRRLGVLKATRNISEGERFTAPPASLLAVVQAGDTFQVRIVVGPVSVERTVTSFAPSRRAASLFVQTEDGQILSVPFPKELR